MNTKVIVSITLITALVLGGIYLSVRQSNAPGPLDEFAQCLKDKDVTFFGAFWCPHCQSQKKLFGNSARLLPYVECSTPDGQGQTQACKDKDIKSYPTWEFADLATSTGELTLEDLSTRSQCPLPVKTETTTS